MNWIFLSLMNQQETLSKGLVVTLVTKQIFFAQKTCRAGATPSHRAVNGEKPCCICWHYLVAGFFHMASRYFTMPCEEVSVPSACTGSRLKLESIRLSVKIGFVTTAGEKGKVGFMTLYLYPLMSSKHRDSLLLKESFECSGLSNFMYFWIVTALSWCIDRFHSVSTVIAGVNCSKESLLQWNPKRIKQQLIFPLMPKTGTIYQWICTVQTNMHWSLPPIIDWFRFVRLVFDLFFCIWLIWLNIVCQSSKSNENWVSFTASAG